MINEYHRPGNESEALALLNRKSPKTVPLGGGTILSKTKETLAVVDLQDLGWDAIEPSKEDIRVGSCATLEALLSFFGTDSAMGRAISIDAGKNIRDMATLGGTLVANDGRSAFLAVLIANGVELSLTSETKVVGIDQWIKTRYSTLANKLIKQVRFPVLINLAFESVGRSPLDKPILCCAVAKSNDHRIRIAFGGFGTSPKLAYDGPPEGDITSGVEKALMDSGDEWASSQYRLETGRLLAKRLVSDAA